MMIVNNKQKWDLLFVENDDGSCQKCLLWLQIYTIVMAFLL